MDFAAGQRWTYRTPSGFETSRLTIGALLTFPGQPRVMCCSVSGAPRRKPDRSVDTVTIPFLPMTEQAIRDTVLAYDGEAEPAAQFMQALEAWQSDPRGLTTFTVPFEGFLDRMIALQMAAIVSRSAA